MSITINLGDWKEDLCAEKGKLWMVDEIGEVGGQITYINGSQARLYIKSVNWGIL